MCFWIVFKRFAAAWVDVLKWTLVTGKLFLFLINPIQLSPQSLSKKNFINSIEKVLWEAALIAEIRPLLRSHVRSAHIKNIKVHATTSLTTIRYSLVSLNHFNGLPYSFCVVGYKLKQYIFDIWRVLKHPFKRLLALIWNLMIDCVQ